jgi:hypothetical protein
MQDPIVAQLVERNCRRQQLLAALTRAQASVLAAADAASVGVGSQAPEPDPAVARVVGPRQVGGRYWSGYWQAGYTVTAIDIEGSPFPTVWISVRWDDGHTGRHCTPWEQQRDRVLAEPTGPTGAAR